MFEVVLHLPYSSYLALSDFWLFAVWKEYLEEIYFTCDEVEAARGKWFSLLSEELYIELEGHCVEK
jgi:hypothetical protein